MKKSILALVMAPLAALAIAATAPNQNLNGAINDTPQNITAIQTDQPAGSIAAINWSTLNVAVPQEQNGTVFNNNPQQPTNVVNANGTNAAFEKTAMIGTGDIKQHYGTTPNTGPNDAINVAAAAVNGVQQVITGNGPAKGGVTS